MSDVEDERFEAISWDPKFRHVPKQERKVKIDKRFSAMFNDSSFKTKQTLDKRGRPIKRTDRENLKQFYELSDDNDDVTVSTTSGAINEDVENKNKYDLKQDKTDVKTESDISESESEESDSEIKIDLARGEGNMTSSDESSNEWQFEDDVQVEHKWGELHGSAKQTDTATARLAICNVDWDMIKAKDLMVLFGSFVPTGGLLKRISIYVSDYGKERLKQEDAIGPPELAHRQDDVISSSSEDELEIEKLTKDKTEENEKVRKQMERLREYQLNRLKYYYGIAEFDSSSSASVVYDQCDGHEYESSAMRIDLRFVPDDMDFEEEPVSVIEAGSDLISYKPTLFRTAALQQSKVELTWDQTDPDRVEKTKRAFKPGNLESMDADLQMYLASSSDENEDNEAMNEKRRQLLSGITDADSVSIFNKQNDSEQEDDKDGEIEISWQPDVQDKVEKLVEKKLKYGSKGETPWQKYLDKRKEKRKERKSESKKKREQVKRKREGEGSTDSEGDVEQEKRLDSNKNNQLSLLVNDEDEKNGQNFAVNTKDKRFNAVFVSSDYNIDPSHSAFRKTPGMEKLVTEKIKRVKKQ